MNTDKLWKAISGIECQLTNLKGELIDIDEETKQSVDEAYQRGLEEGKKATWGLVADASSAEYQRGLDDAWEAARKISLMTSDEIEKVFPGAAKYNRYNLGYSGVEAIEKLKAYEKQKADDEIKVGDEVIYNEHRFIVFATETKEHYASLFDVNGRHASVSQRECKKTGRHFNIDKILEEMKA